MKNCLLVLRTCHTWALLHINRGYVSLFMSSPCMAYTLTALLPLMLTSVGLRSTADGCGSAGGASATAEARTACWPKA